MNKTDWRQAMLVRSVRKHSSVRLDWISKELNMGVRNGGSIVPGLISKKENSLGDNTRKLTNETKEQTYNGFCFLYSFTFASH